MDRPWFERWAERLERELQALRSRGIVFEVDETARSKGVLKVRLTTPLSHPAGKHRLVAIYPGEFPFFRPEVFGPELRLPRHQNHLQRNLCLLRRPTSAWDPEWTLAQLLETQLPKVLETGRITDPNLIRADPSEQAEPRSVFYDYEPGSFVLLDPGVRVPSDVRSGTLILEHSGGGAVFRGGLRRVNDADGALVAEGFPVPKGLFSGRVAVRWIRCDDWPPKGTADGVVSWLKERHPAAMRRPAERVSWAGEKVDITGILCSEEIEPGILGDGWLFVVRHVNKKAKAARRYLARPMRYSEEAVFDRIPELRFLRGATVAQAGVGCIGAPIALELARAGVKTLRLLDHDVVEAGTTVRWPVGLSAAAVSKVAVLAQVIRNGYPFTQAEPVPLRLGAPVDPTMEGGLDTGVVTGFRKRWANEADLILDTTAEWGVNFFLSEVAREKGVPYVLVTGTPGGWGGRMLRIRPGSNRPCWGCVERWRDRDALPEPAALADDLGAVQPAGCDDPTFTGANFELGQVALAGARFAVQTLSSCLGGIYPDAPWDYAVVSLRDEQGQAIAPQWETTKLDPFPGCPRCQAS
jgi:hypothetical protein